ncbi:MAG: hypothetical protein LQ340_003355 [Diploschistes diacapsis]|nr:MAG: hypothetical protein LQ340_003355 [Diploschistes diacapsis]
MEERASFSGYKNVAYFPNWDIYGRNYQPYDLPINDLTHVLYCFCNVGSDGSVELSDTYADLQKHYPTDSWNDVGNNVYGNVKQLYILKKQNRNMKTLLSIGGWTYGPNFAAPLTTAAGRAQFVSTSVTFVKDLGFDGIDIDWEYPADADQASAFVSLLQELRTALDAYTSQYGGPRMLITAAMPAGPQNYDIMQLSQMGQYVDFFNLMAYDYAGSFSSLSPPSPLPLDSEPPSNTEPPIDLSGHMANLYPSASNPLSTPFSTDKAVTDYIAAGVNSRQIVMGIPLYGRSFDDTTGLGQPYNGVGQGSWEAGVWDFKVLPIAPAVEEYDASAGASYSWDSTNQIINSYDNMYSLHQKTSYIESKSLGGAMYWEASGDRNGSQSLMGAGFGDLGAAGGIEQVQNNLNYPASQYANMVAGMPNN